MECGTRAILFVPARGFGPYGAFVSFNDALSNMQTQARSATLELGFAAGVKQCVIDAGELGK